MWNQYGKSCTFVHSFKCFFLFCFLQHSETHTYADINMQAWEDSRNCSGLNVQNANNAKVIMLFHNSLLCFVWLFALLCTAEYCGKEQDGVVRTFSAVS